MTFMTDGMGVARRKKEEIPLQQLAKEFDVETMRTRLGAAYDRAITDALFQLKTQAKKYERDINTALRAGKKDEAELIMDSMPEFFGYEKNNVTIAVGVESGMRGMKRSFIDNAMAVLTTSLLGTSEEMVTAATISFGRHAAAYANLLAPSLNEQLGISKPADLPEGTVIPFEIAKVRKGGLPVTIEAIDGKIVIRYATWLAAMPRAQEL